MKELNCRHVGFDCDGVVTGETDEDVLAQAAEHAKEVHGLSDDQVDDPRFGSRVREQIHEKA